MRRFSLNYLLLAIWLLMYVAFATQNPDVLLRMATIQAVFSSADVYVFLGLAALITLYVGEFDLSVPNAMGLSATLVPVLNVLHGVPLVLSVAIAILTAGIVGAINGFLIVRLAIDPLVTTLATGTVMLGAALGIAHENPVGGLSRGFSELAVNRVFGLTLTFWYGLIIALIFAYVIYFTPLGRSMTFVGSNREVARLAGISVGRIRFGAYLFGSTLAGAAGVLLAARLGGFDPSSSSGYLLPTFATVFVSAAVITLGRFNPIGVLIGAYFISTGTLGLQILGVSGWSQQVFYGLSLVLAVTLVTILKRRSG